MASIDKIKLEDLADSYYSTPIATCSEYLEDKKVNCNKEYTKSPSPRKREHIDSEICSVSTKIRKENGSNKDKRTSEKECKSIEIEKKEKSRSASSKREKMRSSKSAERQIKHSQSRSNRLAPDQRGSEKPRDSDKSRVRSYKHNKDKSDSLSSKRPCVCDRYLRGYCSHGDECWYFHADFPCMYYHTGKTCQSLTYRGACKFSHKPLSEYSRELLVKHLSRAPYYILGALPRLEENARSLVSKIEARNKIEKGRQEKSDKKENQQLSRNHEGTRKKSAIGSRTKREKSKEICTPKNNFGQNGSDDLESSGLKLVLPMPSPTVQNRKVDVKARKEPESNNEQDLKKVQVLMPEEAKTLEIDATLCPDARIKYRLHRIFIPKSDHSGLPSAKDPKLRFDGDHFESTKLADERYLDPRLRISPAYPARISHLSRIDLKCIENQKVRTYNRQDGPKDSFDLFWNQERHCKAISVADGFKNEQGSSSQDLFEIRIVNKRYLQSRSPVFQCCKRDHDHDFTHNSKSHCHHDQNSNHHCQNSNHHCQGSNHQVGGPRHLDNALQDRIQDPQHRNKVPKYHHDYRGHGLVSHHYDQDCQGQKSLICKCRVE